MKICIYKAENLYACCMFIRKYRSSSNSVLIWWFLMPHDKMDYSLSEPILKNGCQHSTIILVYECVIGVGRSSSNLASLFYIPF